MSCLPCQVRVKLKLKVSVCMRISGLDWCLSSTLVATSIVLVQNRNQDPSERSHGHGCIKVYVQDRFVQHTVQPVTSPGFDKCQE